MTIKLSYYSDDQIIVKIKRIIDHEWTVVHAIFKFFTKFGIIVTPILKVLINEK